MLLLACVLGAAFVACVPRTETVQLRFRLAGSDAHRVQFYVHDLVLLDREGQGHALRLTQRPPWQSDRVALIDLSRPTGSVARDVIEGRVDRGVYTGVRFSVGVPFDANHRNPMTAEAPLNRSEMFWSWQSGYKFLRIDVSTAEHAAAFHLGSTGCSSASALRPPAQPCAQPNVIHVELQGFDPLTQPVQVGVGEMAAALSEARACTGDYSHPACARAFAVTGLDVASGQCVFTAQTRTCASQRLFVVP